MSLINCKVEFELKWTRQCVLAADVNNVNANDDDSIFTTKDPKIYVPEVPLIRLIRFK